MLKRVFKLTPDQYEDLYNGELVTSTSGQMTLQMNLTTYTITVNGTTAVTKDEYTIEVSDRYLTPDSVEDMFEDLPTVATTQDVANLFNAVAPETRQLMVDLIYPVGSIYMSVSSTSPAILFGGTWEQLENRFLLGAGSSYTAGATGGEATHTLTIDEMPSHNHVNSNNRNASADVNGTSRLASSNGSGANLDLYNVFDNAGGGQAHNNMPPYLVVYMWKRTA